MSRSSRTSLEETERRVALYNSGLTIKEMAEIVGIKPDSMRVWLYSRGLDTSCRHGKQRNTEIGRRVLRFRSYLGLTLRELSRRYNYSDGYMGLVELGYANPPKQLMEDIAKWERTENFATTPVQVAD